MRVRRGIEEYLVRWRGYYRICLLHTCIQFEEYLRHGYCFKSVLSDLIQRRFTKNLQRK